jgi:uncharacterized protein (TIGR00369 family)
MIVTASHTTADEAYWREMERRYGESPIHKILGLSLHVTGPGNVIVEYDGSDAARNLNGNPAGGALAQMVDSAVFQASRTMLQPGDQAVTLDLKVSLVRAGPVIGGLATEGRVEHVGRLTTVGEARVRDPEGRLVAIGLVTLALRRSALDAPVDARG